MQSTKPKLFISYAWSTQEHMDWVLRLAADLRSNGVDAILDKWHLKEGQDAFAFMERMVTDQSVSKVAVICDKAYAERAKARKGGVGAESQIMSAELYGKVDQTKFVAIAREKDENDRAYMPAFFTTRIYIDLSEGADFARGFEQLLRWCFDKPLYVEPELGEPPAFLDEEAAPMVARAAPVERLLREPIPNEQNIVTAAVSFLREISVTSVDFQAKFEPDEAHDEAVFRTIEGLAPLVGQLLRVVEGAIQADDEGRVQIAFHDYLEHIIPHLDAGPTKWSPDPTKFYAHFAFVAFLAISVRNRKLEVANLFLNSPYLKESYSGMTGKSVTYEVFRAYLPSLDARNSRLGLNRLSLHADLIKQVCDTIGFAFRDFVQADFILYLRGAALGFERNEASTYRGWWPTSALYITDVDGALPAFVRAEDPKYRDGLLATLGIRSKTELEALIQGYKSGQLKAPEWHGAFSRLDVLPLMNAERILASYG
jgi:hypothetical protein